MTEKMVCVCWVNGLNCLKIIFDIEKNAPEIKKQRGGIKTVERVWNGGYWDIIEKNVSLIMGVWRAG